MNMIPPLETDSTPFFFQEKEEQEHRLFCSNLPLCLCRLGLRPAETIDSQAGGLALAKRDSLTTKASFNRLFTPPPLLTYSSLSKIPWNSIKQNLNPNQTDQEQSQLSQLYPFLFQAKSFLPATQFLLYTRNSVCLPPPSGIPPFLYPSLSLCSCNQKIVMFLELSMLLSSIMLLMRLIC